MLTCSKQTAFSEIGGLSLCSLTLAMTLQSKQRGTNVHHCGYKYYSVFHAVLKSKSTVAWRSMETNCSTFRGNSKTAHFLITALALTRRPVEIATAFCNTEKLFLRCASVLKDAIIESHQPLKLSLSLTESSAPVMLKRL